MPTRLDDIVANTRREIRDRKQRGDRPSVARSNAPSFRDALRGDGLKLVTEIKPASPSAGVLQADLDLPLILDAYNRYAAAISVLTDRKFFNGSLDLLAEVSVKSPRPTLCKDFILDPVQVADARAVGAAAVLLIVKILDDAELGDLHAAIVEQGMTPVVEIQNEAELDRALAVDPSVILVNNRDLTTFEISFDTTKRLVPRIPRQIFSISASGIQSRKDIEALRGYTSRFLIGTSLMQSQNPIKTLEDLISP